MIHKHRYTKVPIDEAKFGMQFNKRGETLTETPLTTDQIAALKTEIWASFEPLIDLAAKPGYYGTISITSHFQNGKHQLSKPGHERIVPAKE